MKYFKFELQRFAESGNNQTGFDALELMHGIIQRFDLKTVDDTKLQDGSSTINSTLKFIGTFWGSLFFKESTRTTEVSSLTTMLASTVSIVEDIYAIREEKNKDNPSEVIITSKAEDYISNLASLTNAFQKLSSDKNSFILSVVSSVVGLTTNLVLGMDGLKEEVVEKINKSYVGLLQVCSAEIIKKFFSEGLADNLIKMPTNQILEIPGIREELGKQFTKDSGPLGLIFAAITGVLNGVNEYDSRIKKYTEDGIPEDIAKHDAIIDALATFVHDTASSYAKGFDDTVFKWLQAGLSFIRGEDIPYYTDKNYVEVIADWFKTLNYKNSGTSKDDKFYVLEDNSMVYGNDGDDYIGNYGFSNVTIWGGRDDDTLGSYKTDSATPQKNSIFGGPGDDQISVYDIDSTIYGGTGKDFINVVGTSNEILGDEDDDKLYLANDANDNAVNGGTGDDFIVMLEGAKNTLIKYSTGDGNDTIYGFNEDDALKISGSYDTSIIGSDVKITVDNGSILLIGAAGKNIKINDKNIKVGEENPSIEPVPPPEFPTLPATVASPIIYGTEGDDTIGNSKDYMVIQALGGNDSIRNLYGNNITINGDAGNDYIKNGDYWTKGGSQVIINGGAGNDSIFNSGSNVTINTGDGSDTVKNVESDYNNSYGPSSEDSVSINTGSGNDSVLNDGWYCTIETGLGNDSVYNHGSNVIIKTRDGDDAVRNIKENYTSSLEYLYDGSDSVSIDTGSGNDSVTNYGDFVTVNTGAGNDSVFNYYGVNATINAGEGDDSVYNALVGYSTINPGAGNDFISLASYSFSNVIEYNAGDGNDVITGFKADSTLAINEGSYSTTKSGNDIVVTVGDGSIILKDAASLSTVNIDGEEENLTELTFNNKTDSVITIPAQTEIVDASKRTRPIKITGNTLANSLFGGKGNDTLDGVEGDNTLTGGKGKDTFIFSGGKNIITDYETKDKISVGGGLSYAGFAVDGDDVILSFNDSDSLMIIKGAGKAINMNSTINFYTSDGLFDKAKKSIILATEIETFNATNYSQLATIDGSSTGIVEIIGNSKANSIVAGTSGSTLNGGKGKDTLVGGDGSDIFVYGKSDGKDVIENYGAGDKISLGSDVAIKDVMIKNGNTIFKIGSGSVTVNDTTKVTLTSDGNDTIFSDGLFIIGDSIKVIGDYKGTIDLNEYSNITTIDASLDNNKLTINGGDADNLLIGGRGKDKIYGNAGNDTLWGGKKNDTLYGGDGDDTFIFQAGNGNDVIADYQSGELLQILNKRGNEGDFKKSMFKNDTLTLTIQGGGKVILKGVDSSTDVNINDESYHVEGKSLV